MQSSEPPPRKLFDRVRNAIRLKHYSYRTEETHVQWIRQNILFGVAGSGYETISWGLILQSKLGNL